MKNYFPACFGGSFRRASVSLLMGAALLLACSSPAAAQKKKKNDTTPGDSSSLPMSDEQQIDYNISEMLGAWQLGDTERLHKDYAEDVSVVNGIWAPPVFGWPSYLAVYQQQRARMQQVRMDRSNTYIKLSGNVAWACYQWDFSAVVDGQPVVARGQTTLIFEKRNNQWLIVLNHTSAVPTTPPTPPANTPQITQPQQPHTPAAR
ncbi:MAG: nuclear transport factor 2 family protein [Candidatus Acidiferrum sp.]|jgi:ketosteroid isomerase-like protein